MKTAYKDIAPYTTKDGSLIRELMHPAVHGNMNLSFAEATIEPGRGTIAHAHQTSEEIYHVVRGVGLMHLGEQRLPLAPGDTVCILPDTMHRVENTGNEPLVIYCCCAPPYSHQDTKMRPEMD